MNVRRSLLLLVLFAGVVAAQEIMEFKLPETFTWEILTSSMNKRYTNDPRGEDSVVSSFSVSMELQFTNCRYVDPGVYKANIKFANFKAWYDEISAEGVMQIYLDSANTFQSMNSTPLLSTRDSLRPELAKGIRSSFNYFFFQGEAILNTRGRVITISGEKNVAEFWRDQMQQSSGLFDVSLPEKPIVPGTQWPVASVIKSVHTFGFEGNGVEDSIIFTYSKVNNDIAHFESNDTLLVYDKTVNYLARNFQSKVNLVYYTKTYTSEIDFSLEQMLPISSRSNSYSEGMVQGDFEYGRGISRFEIKEYSKARLKR